MVVICVSLFFLFFLLCFKPPELGVTKSTSLSDEIHV